MDDQKPQDQNTSDNNNDQDVTNTPINDITPPPTEESTSQKINVTTSLDSKDTEEKTDENIQVVVKEPAEEPVEENSVDSTNEEVLSQEDEQLAPVTAPPDEKTIGESENDEEKTEKGHKLEDQNSVNSAPQMENSQNSQAQAPAVMGVAASQMNKHPHRNNKKLATIVTIMTALILSGVAVYVYMSANKNTNVDNSETSKVEGSSSDLQQDITAKPATAEDIDQTIADVEESLSALDDNADFNEDSLSNDTLGL